MPKQLKTLAELDPSQPEQQPLEMVATAADFTGCLECGQFEFWITSPTGIAVAPEIPETLWRTHTANVAMMYEAVGKKHSQAAMILGDLLAFGEERFGERYADCIDSTREYMRVAISTLKNWQWISGKIDPSRRRENLSLSHHEAVAKLPADEQNEFLRLADNEGLSVTELKAKIKEAHPGKPRGPKATTEVKINTDNPQAIKDAISILTKHLTEQEADLDDETIDALEALAKLWRRHRQNGKAKKQEPAEATK